MRNRSKLLIAGGAAALLLAAHHPTADIRVVTHNRADPAPYRVQAAVDLGLMAVTVLVTWTGKSLSR